MGEPIAGITRRGLIKAGAIAALDAALPKVASAQPRIILNDASGLSPTPVFRPLDRADRTRADVIARLRKELKDAAARAPPGLRQRGASFDGRAKPAAQRPAITLDLNICEPDRRQEDLPRACRHALVSGDRAPRQIGFSPAVMQSNSDFGVAATFSVNAHGWPVPYGPFGSTVRSLRLMLADGSIVTCSRTENPELFGLAMGGYGLVGIILDLEVDMVENMWLKPTPRASCRPRSSRQDSMRRRAIPRSR